MFFLLQAQKSRKKQCFLDVFDLKYVTRNNNNNNNNSSKNKNKKNIWHLWSLVRADPAAERREYNWWKTFWALGMYEPLSMKGTLEYQRLQITTLTEWICYKPRLLLYSRVIPVIESILFL